MSILSSFNYKLKRKIKAIGVMLRAFDSFEEFLGHLGSCFSHPLTFPGLLPGEDICVTLVSVLGSVR